MHKITVSVQPIINKREEQRQAAINTLADKRKRGTKLTMEDLDVKMDIVIEMLTELLDKK